MSRNRLTWSMFELISSFNINWKFWIILKVFYSVPKNMDRSCMTCVQPPFWCNFFESKCLWSWYAPAKAYAYQFPCLSLLSLSNHNVHTSSFLALARPTFRSNHFIAFTVFARATICCLHLILNSNYCSRLTYLYCKRSLHMNFSTSQMSLTSRTGHVSNIFAFEIVSYFGWTLYLQQSFCPLLHGERGFGVQFFWAPDSGFRTAFLRTADALRIVVISLITFIVKGNVGLAPKLFPWNFDTFWT